MAANHNPSDFKELELLKWQATKLQRTLRMNKMISSAGVDAKIVIIRVIVLGALIRLSNRFRNFLIVISNRF